MGWVEDEWGHSDPFFWDKALCLEPQAEVAPRGKMLDFWPSLAPWRTCLGPALLGQIFTPTPATVRQAPGSVGLVGKRRPGLCQPLPGALS